MKTRMRDEYDEICYYGLFQRDGKFELFLPEHNDVQIFDSYEESVNYLSELGYEDVRKVVEYSKYMLSSIGFIELDKAEYAEKLSRINEIEKNDSSTVFRKINQFLSSRSYYFKDADNYQIDVQNGDYKVYQWYLEEGHNIFYVGYTIDDFSKNHYRKQEYELIADKKMNYEIVADHLSEDAAFIYAKGLVFQYSDAGDYILEATGYSYRDYNDKIAKKQHLGIYDDGFISKYCPEYMSIDYTFDKPDINKLKTIYFVGEGDSELSIWVTKRGGKISKNIGKKTAVIVENSITYSLYLTCRKIGCSIYSLQDVIQIIRTESVIDKPTKVSSMPTFDLALRGKIREILEGFKERKQAFDEYMSHCTSRKRVDIIKHAELYEGEEPYSYLSEAIKGIDCDSVILNYIDYLYYQDDELYIRKPAKTYVLKLHNLGLFDEEIELLEKYKVMGEQLAKAIMAKEAELNSDSI